MKILLNYHVLRVTMVKYDYGSRNTLIVVNYNHMQETETNHYFILLTNGKSEIVPKYNSFPRSISLHFILMNSSFSSFYEAFDSR